MEGGIRLKNMPENTTAHAEEQPPQCGSGSQLALTVLASSEKNAPSFTTISSSGMESS